MRHEVGAFVILAVIVIGFWSLLTYYGDKLPLPWCDDVFFIQPAENLANGYGMGTPVLNNLLPNISKRTYWQPPVYFLSLALWGKFLGFDLTEARTFSRVLGVLGLVLLFFLSRQWGLSAWASLLPVFWVSLDLVYQYRSNMVRPDVLTSVLVMATVISFGEAIKRDEMSLFRLSGIFGTLASLCHFISIPILVFLTFTLAVMRHWRALSTFIVPFTVGWGMWLLYALQDWQAFVAQLRYQFTRHGKLVISTLMQWSELKEWLFLARWVDTTLLPNNEPPWAVVMGAWLLMVAMLRIAFGKGIIPSWKVGLILSAYLTTTFLPRREMHYLAIFAPLGYLAVVTVVHYTVQKVVIRHVLLALALLWGGIQTVRIYMMIAAIPQVEVQVKRIFRDLERKLPQGATVLLQCSPDPYFHLKRKRPDLVLYEIYLHITPEQFKQLYYRADYIVWMTEINSMSSLRCVRNWTIRLPWLGENGVYKIWLMSVKRESKGKG